MSTAKIVVLGSVNQDHVTRCDHLPSSGETIISQSYFHARGGKGANQAVAIAKLGAPLTFVACLGKDAYAKELIEEYNKINIDTRYMCQLEGFSTGVALIMVDKDGNNCISVAPNANSQLNTSFITKHQSLFEDAEFFLTQLETPIDGVELAIKYAKNSGTYVILNPAPAATLSEDIYSYIDLITPNETEAYMLTGIEVTDEISAKKAARCLQDKGVKNIIITLGKRGAYLLTSDHQGELISGYTVEAKDTTAAGDTFSGALVVALSEGKSIKEAVLFAHKASALSVMRLGAQTSIPTREDVDQANLTR